jgi:predicted RNase H-like HicB family nuclease
MAEEREFTVIIEEDEDGYLVAEVPQLRSCYTQARDMDELMERIREVILLCLEDEPEPPRMKLVGVQRVAV